MLSAVVLTKNEEKRIAGCLKNLMFCDEIVVIDDNSKDDTGKLAERSGARVFERGMNRDYSAQSNFGMGKAKGDWIFFVDADEEVTKDLAEEIKTVINKESGYLVYSIKRTDYMWGRWLKHGESGKSRVTRLVKRGSGVWKRRVHPYFDSKSKIYELKYPILHYPHPDLSNFIESVDRWSSWHAQANAEEGKKSSLLKIIFMPIAHFMKNYVFSLGFLDGMPGFVYASVMSIHSYLAWSKLWLNQNPAKN